MRRIKSCVPESTASKKQITPPLRGSRREGEARIRAGGGPTRRRESAPPAVDPEGGHRGVAREPSPQSIRWWGKRPGSSPGGHESGDGGIAQEIVPKGIALLGGGQPKVHPAKLPKSRLAEHGPVGLGFEVEVVEPEPASVGIGDGVADDIALGRREAAIPAFRTRSRKAGRPSAPEP